MPKPAPPSRDDLARDVIATACAMNTLGINNGMSGNVSVRHDDRVLITPSSVAYDELGIDDIVTIAPSGSWTVPNDRRPSSEWRFHVDILEARPEAGAVVHAHPVNATALSTHRRGIGPFHYMVGICGGHDIRCAPYATFGTPELSANALRALEGRRACLLANHGVIAIGATLAEALALAVEVEVLAAQYLAALALGEPVELTNDEMDAVIMKMRAGQGYGSS